ncbi:hypothetical protein [Gynuella sp.]|uniref:hypothetical protein n=1 Tax=Gynuella sp. TaxID=2969146 RepID=UPI003D0E005E
MKYALFLFTALILNACAMQSVKHAYEGELESTDRLAIIWTAGENFTSIQKVNDEKVNAFVKAVYIKPGSNTVHIQRSEEIVLGVKSNWNWVFKFNAEAGHTYYFAPVPAGINQYSLVGYDGGTDFPDVTQDLSSKEHKHLRNLIKHRQTIMLYKP